jgi:quinol monooxygenase YgiN
VSSAPDTWVSVRPYFRVHAGRGAEFRELCQRFVDAVEPDPGCVRYSWTFDGDVAHCREDFVDAATVLAHFGDVGSLPDEMQRCADLVRFEVHGPADQLDALRPSLETVDAQFFTLGPGFRR